MGGVLRARGDLDAAEAVFAEYLAIRRRLAELDPSMQTGSATSLMARSCMGGVLEGRGDLEAAEAAFTEFRAISQRLAEQDPSKVQTGNVTWR